MDDRVRVSFSLNSDAYSVMENRYVFKEEMSKPYLDKVAAEMVGVVLERVFNER